MGDNGSILDGSHRTAIAWYYDYQLPIVHIAGKSKNYNYEFFKERGLSDKYLDFMSWLFILYSKQSYVACLWPRACGKTKLNAADRLISKRCGIFYRKEIKFNYHGIEQLMIHVYGKQPWAGSVDDGYKGIPIKARNCYRNSAFTTVYILPGVELDKILSLKSEIRELFQIENHSIHITDTREEAIEAAQVLLFENSVTLLNYGEIVKDKKLAATIIEHHAKRHSNELILNTLAVKSLLGLRQANLSKDIWMPVDQKEINMSLECGFVFGERFVPCCNKELSLRERLILGFQRFKYGALADAITNFRLKEQIRHLGGRILRIIRVR